MTCRVPAAEGMRIETQNVVGSQDTDLLRDGRLVLPRGDEPSRALRGRAGRAAGHAGVRATGGGLGRLPARSRRRPRARGGARSTPWSSAPGPAGMAAAAGAGGRGARSRWSTTISRGAGPPAPRAAPGEPDLGGPRSTRSEAAVAASRDSRPPAHDRGGHLRRRRPARRDGEGGAGGASRSSGAHAGPRARRPRRRPRLRGQRRPGRDERARRLRLSGARRHPGRAQVVVAASRGGPFGAAYAAARPGRDVVSARCPSGSAGALASEAVTIGDRRAGDRRRSPATRSSSTRRRAPAYELCAQAGARARRTSPAGSSSAPARAGRVRDGVFAVGEVVGPPRSSPQRSPGAVGGDAAHRRASRAARRLR